MPTKAIATKGPTFPAGIPPYPGGKRRLLPAILGLVAEAVPPREWRRRTFADGFMGAGTVALTAKALGFQSVVANDIAERSAIVGVGAARERLGEAARRRRREPVQRTRSSEAK